ncbi:GNAT family N-acetyltransferase [Staphylococcus sp. 11261D007BR]
MNYQIQEDSHRFYINDEHARMIAEITFNHVGNDVIDVNHTYVSPVLRGEGIAKQLFNKVIDKARREQLKIIPTCSYVSHQFEKNEDLNDLKA